MSNCRVELYMNGESLDGFGDRKVISHIPIRDKTVWYKYMYIYLICVYTYSVDIQLLDIKIKLDDPVMHE